MAFDPALSPERLRHDMNPEMAFAARPMTGVAFVTVRFVNDLEIMRRKCRVKLFGDPILHLHEREVSGRRATVNPMSALAQLAENFSVKT
jgi:hypothetical protein